MLFKGLRTFLLLAKNEEEKQRQNGSFSNFFWFAVKEKKGLVIFLVC